jgi:hypothetical protein
MDVFRARSLALWVALLSALPVGVAGSVQYFCHSMGRLMDECCCTPADSLRIPNVTHVRGGSELRVLDCCQRLNRASSAAAPALRESTPSTGATAALAEPVPWVVFVSEPEARDLVVEPVEARARPPRGPPIFLLNCALLT